MRGWLSRNLGIFNGAQNSEQHHATQGPLFNRYHQSILHDGYVRITTPNYGGLGSLPHYDWNMPRTGSQPVSPPPQMPLWNILEPTNWVPRNIPAAQLGAYLVPAKTYGKPMEYKAADIASLKG